MKSLYFFFILILFCNGFAQSNNNEQIRPFLMSLDHYNQTYIIKTQSFRLRWLNGLTQDNAFLIFEDIPCLNNDSARIMVSSSAEQQKVITDIELPNSVYIPDKNSNPEPSQTQVANTKEIVFENYGDEKLVITGERVNIRYKNLPSENTFIKYRSVEEGYFLQWLETKTVTPVKFDQLCQSFIVASPSKTIIMFDESLRYDQIVWTPFGNGQWEVRIGTHDREGCKSEALDKINKLQTKEYKNSRKYLIKK